jgi:hypothetical protein
MVALRVGAVSYEQITPVERLQENLPISGRFLFSEIEHLVPEHDLQSVPLNDYGTSS